MKTLRLPIPPSVNQAFANNKSGKGKGRYKTRQYRAWIKAADHMALCHDAFRERPFVTGPAIIRIRLPTSVRGDVSNRIKTAEDYLVDRGFTDDDSKNVEVTAMKDPAMGKVPWCEIDIEPANGGLNDS